MKTVCMVDTALSLAWLLQVDLLHRTFQDRGLQPCDPLHLTPPFYQSELHFLDTRAVLLRQRKRGGNLRLKAFLCNSRDLNKPDCHRLSDSRTPLYRLTITPHLLQRDQVSRFKLRLSGLPQRAPLLLAKLLWQALCLLQARTIILYNDTITRQEQNTTSRRTILPQSREKCLRKPWPYSAPITRRCLMEQNAIHKPKPRLYLAWIKVAGNSAPVPNSIRSIMLMRSPWNLAGSYNTLREMEIQTKRHQNCPPLP